MSKGDLVTTPARPAVSVVIPAFDCAHLIAEAILSVRRQSLTALEIIVIDDGSTDGTAEVVRSLAGPTRYFRQRNSGQAVARNRGILHAAGDFIAFLDADDVWLPGKLEAQVRYFETHPDAVLVHTDSAVFDAQGVRDGSRLEGASVDDENAFRNLLKKNFIHTSTVMIRREALAASGLFDPSLRGPEDYDLWLRLAKAGEIGCIREVLTLYRHHDGNMHRSLLFQKNAIKCQKILEARWGDDPECLALIRDGYGAAQWDMGYAAKERGEFRRAAAAYAKSAWSGPKRWASLARALFFLLPSGLIRRILGGRMDSCGTPAR